MSETKPKKNREREGILQAILDSAVDYAIITIGPDNVISSWNAGAQNLFGWESKDVIGQSGEVIFAPEDRERGIAAAELETARTRGRAEDERWHLRKNGTRFWGSGLLVPIRSRQAAGYLKIMRDRSQHRQSEQALRESEQRFRSLVEHIPQLIWRSRSMGDCTWGSPQWAAFTGLPEEKSMGMGWLEVLHPDDHVPTKEAWREAEKRGELYVEHRIRCAADGTYRWFQTRASRAADRSAGGTEWFGTSTDVHEMRLLQERQQALVRELHHRTGNLLAIVSSIARRTISRSQTLTDFEARFGNRIAALARVQALIARAHRGALGVEELVQMEINAQSFDGGKSRIVIEGPEITLPDKSAETLALALHELATNAARHGALSNLAGTLNVTWQVRCDKWLSLEWRERGGGCATKADSLPRGYGREFIEVALPHALNARTHLEFGPEGVTCTIELPDYETSTEPSEHLS